MAYLKEQFKRGFSLIEVLIVAAVIALFFGGLFLTIQQSIKLTTDTRGRLTALTVANDYIEYIRSLSYDNVGTVSGIPSGLLPQNSTTTLNGIEFNRRVLIEYIDSPADGLGASDSNGITTDYKQAKVEVSWSLYGDSDSVFLVTNIIPRSIETDVGGGTVRVNVFDADVQPLPGATVRLVNTTGTSSIDVTRYTDATGIALFGGAPANSNYQIFVSGSGYSSDQTYVATTSLPNPTTQPFAVEEADITTMNFQIDRLGGLNVRALASQTYNETETQFDDISEVASSSNINVVGGNLVLSGGGPYAANGVAYLPALTPSTIESWDSVDVVASTSAATSYKIRFYTGTSTYTLVPDSDLAGNSSGFNTDVIDISSLDPVTYPSLVIGLELSTTNSSVSPSVDSVSVLILEEETPRSGLSITAKGAKTIGTLTDGSLVYKTILSDSTDSNGEIIFSDIEFDTYTLTASGYDIAEACSEHPAVVNPGNTTSVDVIYVNDSPNSLRVIVEDSSGNPIKDATVELIKGSVQTKTTSPCGQVFFPSLLSPDYELRVSATGYSTFSLDPLSISGDILQTVTLTP